MCIVCIANNINRNVYMYLNTRIFPTTGYARVLLFMFIGREHGGTGTGCLFQFTYCDILKLFRMTVWESYNSRKLNIQIDGALQTFVATFSFGTTFFQKGYVIPHRCILISW